MFMDLVTGSSSASSASNRVEKEMSLSYRRLYG